MNEVGKAPNIEGVHDVFIKQMEAENLYKLIDLSLDLKNKPMFYQLTNMMKDQKEG